MEPVQPQNYWKPHYTYADFEKWEGSWELIDGFPHAMSRSPKRTHQALAARFIQISMNTLEKQREGCSCGVYHELDWIISEDTIVRPDAMIVCGPFTTDFLTFPPSLILEVSSESTRMKDRNVKFHLYAAQGVRYYLIADPDRKTMEAFELRDNRYADFSSDSFILTNTCTIQLSLESIWT
jgi:Uma2 family endonuclease